jgi:IS30 family transposase
MEANMKSKTHFTMEQRISLSDMFLQGKSQTEMAEELAVHKSRVCRELKRNRTPKGRYEPHYADARYRHRRKRCVRGLRFANDPKLSEFAKDGFSKGWTPEIICVKWKQKDPAAKLSWRTLYNAVKRGEFEGVRAETHLRRRGKLQKHKGRMSSATIKPDHVIHERPPVVELRTRRGDLEGDTVYGAVGKGAALTVVDRTSRMLYATLLANLQASTIRDAFYEVLSGVPVQTITLDNGSEFAKHRLIATDLKTTIYFADPHSPWQRGSNENINGLLRFWFPKGTNFLEVNEQELQRVVNLINNRPRECLNWMSPIEFETSLHLA